MLDAKITVKEVQAAMFAFHLINPQDSRLIFINFYKLNVELLATRFNWLIEHCPEQYLPDSMMEAYMILLPKPGKDPTECAPYRPIAFLNTDLKILTKLLATRLAKVIQTIVNIVKVKVNDC